MSAKSQHPIRILSSGRGRPNQMIELWLAQCQKLIKPNDTLVFVGDLGITLDDLEFFERLPPCDKILVLGDKEYANKSFSRDDFLLRNDELGIFDEIVDNIVLTIAGREFFLSHKPTDCLAQECPAICGHVHGIWRSQRMPNRQPIINVGIDAWGGIVSEAFIDHQHNAITKGYYDENCFPRDWV